jgi:hypothetical protein
MKLTSLEQFHNIGAAASGLGDAVAKPFIDAMKRIGVPVEAKPKWHRLWWIPPYLAVLMSLLCLFIAGSFVVRDGDPRSASIAAGIAVANLGVAAWLVWLHRSERQESGRARDQHRTP